MNLISLIFVLFLGFYGVKSVSLPDVIEWPIYAVDRGHYYDYSTHMMLGTPPQIVEVSFGGSNYKYDLQIVANNDGTHSDGQFNGNKSSTFALNTQQQDPEDNLFIGYRYKETFHINGIERKDVPFRLVKIKTRAFGFLGFSYHDGGKVGEFWQGLFDELNSTIVTIALGNDLQTGAVTVGGQDRTRCKNDWHIMDEVFYKNVNSLQNHFGPKVKDVHFGKTIIKSPKTGWHLYFRLDSFEIIWPGTIYNDLLKELGSKDNETVSCETKMNVDIRMGRTVLSLTPDEYLKKEKDGRCILNGFAAETDNEIVLSNVLFKRHCVFFDHKNKKFGIGTKKNAKGKKTLRYVN